MTSEPPRELSDAQRAHLASARLLALDVDGTLTDGSIVYSGEVEVVRFHVHDGQGLAWLRRIGVEVAWITGRGSRATRVRAVECGVRALSTGVKDKGRALESVQAELGIGPAQTVAMGDDLPDLALYRRAAFFAAPADARPEVRAVADLVTRAGGGRGAVRELCEAILIARGVWTEILEADPR